MTIGNWFRGLFTPRAESAEAEAALREEYGAGERDLELEGANPGGAGGLPSLEPQEGAEAAEAQLSDEPPSESAN